MVRNAEVADETMTSRHIIDLSVPITEMGGEPLPPSITYHDHSWGASRMAFAPLQDPRSKAKSVGNILKSFRNSRRVRKASFPDGQALAWESIRTETHHGTHVDAPWHYGPRTAGKPARTIDQMPLDWFMRPGVRLDLRYKPPGSTITVVDLEEILKSIHYTLQPMDIVMLWTGVDRYWGQPEYLERYSGLDGASTIWLLNQGVKVIGTDAWSVDRPPLYMGRDYMASGDSRHLWPAHFAGREREYAQIEKLAHLGDLPEATGYTVVCFPVSIERASAGWTRAVAILD